MECAPCVPPRSGTPSPHAIVGADEVLARERGVVPIRPPLDQLAGDERRPPVAAAVVRAQRVAEGAGRRREEGWREGARRAFGEEGDARLELEGQLREGWEVGVRRTWIAVVGLPFGAGAVVTVVMCVGAAPGFLVR